MAFDRTGFGPIGGQGSRGVAPQMFSYKTTDAATAVDGAGYFNDVSGILEVGDVILRITTSGANVSTAGFHIVVSNAAGVVDVTNADALTLSDAD